MLELGFTLDTVHSRAGEVLHCALPLKEWLYKDGLEALQAIEICLLPGLTLSWELNLFSFLCCCFASRASGTVYTAIDIATGQEVGVNTPSNSADGV